MIEVNFCRAPSHNWVGWAWYENGLYYSAGKTLDNLLHRIKNNFYAAKRISARQIYMAPKQSVPEAAPLDRMSQIFKSKYWVDKLENGYGCSPVSRFKQPVAETMPTKVDDEVQEIKYDYYEYKVKDGRLVVYGIIRREVDSFDLRKNQNEGGDNGGNE